MNKALKKLLIFTAVVSGVLIANSFIMADYAPTRGMSNPMTAIGDMIFGSTAGTPTRLPIGTSTQVLTVSATGTPVWANASGGSSTTIINGVNGPAFTFATGTSGTDFNLATSTGTLTFNLPTASSTVRGLLSSADWLNFNNKLSTSTGLLATGATTGATSQAQAFTNGVKTNLLFPPSDSTNAFNLTKANGTTSIFKLDSTNSRIGILTTPSYTFDVNGVVRATNLISGLLRADGNGISFADSSSNVIMNLSEAGVLSIGYSSQTVITPDWSGSGGNWIDMPVTGPSGIGTGGPGANPWLAYVYSYGQWFTDAVPGDIAYRNTGGRLLFGNFSGNSDISLYNGNLGVGVSYPAYKADIAGDVNITGNYYINGVPINVAPSYWGSMDNQWNPGYSIPNPGAGIWQEIQGGWVGQDQQGFSFNNWWETSPAKSSYTFNYTVNLTGGNPGDIIQACIFVNGAPVNLAPSQAQVDGAGNTNLDAQGISVLNPADNISVGIVNQSSGANIIFNSGSFTIKSN